VNQVNDLNNIVIIGSTIIDLNIYSDRLPSAGESLVASNMTVQVGGKASNQAIAASRLGAVSWLITKLGQDEWAASALSLWGKEKVRTDYVNYHPYELTGLGIAVVASNGENWTVSSLNSNKHLNPADIEVAVDLIRCSKVLTIHLNAPLETISRALSLARLNNVLTILNASPVGELGENILTMADILIVNQFEASQLSGCDVYNDETAYAAARSLQKKGANNVIVSLGAGGVNVCTPDQCKRYGAFSVTAIDTVGAGDAFIAGLAVTLAEGKTLFDAAYFANAVSALSVTKRGSWQGTPTRSVVDSFIENQLQSKIT
jgi:ribokinase